MKRLRITMKKLSRDVMDVEELFCLIDSLCIRGAVKEEVGVPRKALLVLRSLILTVEANWERA